MNKLSAFIIMFTMNIVGVFLYGITLSYLSDWFLVDLGFPKLGMFHLLGIATIVSFCTSQYIPNSEECDIVENLGKVFGISIAKPLLFMLLGYIYYCCM